MLEKKCLEGHSSEHYSGRKWLNIGVTMGSGKKALGLSHPCAQLVIFTKLFLIAIQK